MFYVKVDKLPKKDRRLSISKEPKKYNNIAALLEEFVSEDIPLAKLAIPEGTYKTIECARCSMVRAIKNMGLPIHIRVINGDLYLIRVDLM